MNRRFPLSPLIASSLLAFAAPAAADLPTTPPMQPPCSGACDVVLCSPAGCAIWICDYDGCRITLSWEDEAQAPTLAPRTVPEARRTQARRDLTTSPRG
ncbi:hypothetical protein [Arenimonas composti]|uniref:Secreted protein n=1 Tax=Arenimonas composti TR7-09 = DSM 18010 TaxID=1121013 RepID=A0A091BL55_9GAMM|nr:hypothetical protein [Arenimonas composti]KFN51539.1 hypothetical protein P873_00335 [Arenimonas composti TR7-09 = DSM 18010]